MTDPVIITIIITAALVAEETTAVEREAVEPAYLAADLDRGATTWVSQLTFLR